MSRPKLVVATTFSVHPPRGGGQSRVAGLYGALARLGVDVEIVALVGRRDPAGPLAVASGLREVRVPRTPEHEYADWQLYRRAGVPVGDLGLALHNELTPAYRDAIAAAARNADAVVACHPYAHPVLVEAAPGLPLIYEAQDVEADLKAAMYEGTLDGPELTETVRALEHGCCSSAHHVIVCAERDGGRLGELYGLEPERVVEVPNGADPARIPFTSLARRRERRRALRLDSDLLALFVGSWHEPNLVAVRDLMALSEQLAGVRVLVCGSAGLAFAEEPIPGNVDLCGVVDEAFLQSVLGLADAALNPMRFGSGTNLKMLDYALAGIPLVSSQVGVRGLDLEPDRHFVPAEPAQIPEALRALREQPPETVQARAVNARGHVEERFSWARIAGAWNAHAALRTLLDAVEVSA